MVLKNKSAVVRMEVTIFVKGRPVKVVQPSNKTMEEVRRVLEMDARLFGYVKRNATIPKLKLLRSDGSKLHHFDMQTTLGDLIADMGSKPLVAVVKRGQYAPRVKATRNSLRAALKNYWAVRIVERAFRHTHSKSTRTTPTSANGVNQAQTAPPYPAREEGASNDNHGPTPRALQAETEPPGVIETHKRRKLIRKIDFITDYSYSTDEVVNSQSPQKKRTLPRLIIDEYSSDDGLPATPQPEKKESKRRSLVDYDPSNNYSEASVTQAPEKEREPPQLVMDDDLNKKPEAPKVDHSGHGIHPIDKAAANEIPPSDDVMNDMVQKSHTQTVLPSSKQVTEPQVRDEVFVLEDDEEPLPTNERLDAAEAVAPPQDDVVSDKLPEGHTRAGVILRNNNQALSQTVEGRAPKPQRLTDFAQYFHLKVPIAAHQLGMPYYEFMQLYNDSGLTKWPYRKVNRLRKSIKVLERAIALKPGEFSAPFTEENRRQKEQLEQVMRCNLDELESLRDPPEVDKNRSRLNRIATQITLSHGEVVESSDSE